MQFGRKSEKLGRQIEQLELRLGELEASRARDLAPVESAAASPVARPARRPLPAHLPREVRTYTPQQQDCPDCGREMKHLGEDVSEMLEYVPEHFKVIRHVRPKRVCLRCDRIVQAMAPSRPIRAWNRWSRAVSPRAGLEILRSSSSVSTVGDLCAGGSAAGAVDAGGMGGWLQPVSQAAGGSVAYGTS